MFIYREREREREEDILHAHETLLRNSLWGHFSISIGGLRGGSVHGVAWVHRKAYWGLTCGWPLGIVWDAPWGLHLGGS